MHNVWLIARREYIERIRTRGFLFTTILIPLIMGGLLLGGAFLSSRTGLENHIAIVSSDAQLTHDLQSELQHQNRYAIRSGMSKPKRLFVYAIELGPDTRSVLDADLDAGNLDGYLWITPAASPNKRPTFTFTPRSTEQEAIRAALADTLNKVLLREQLAHRGIAAAEADSILQPVEIVAAAPTRVQNRESEEVSVIFIFVLMYFVILYYGMNVARSIIEEKSSRIFEVMLATVRPEAMMAGKIIGVGSVGLTQVGIWISAGAAVVAGLTRGGVHLAFSPSQVMYFLIYFILGYLFYSSIAAALGAMTNSEQELQQLNIFLALPLMCCFFMLKNMLTSPDGRLATTLAMVPPFTPLLMYLRVSLGHPSKLAIVSSIVLTSVCIYGIIWVASRIYRTGVLMYGKRPNLSEILRWLRYS